MPRAGRGFKAGLSVQWDTITPALTYVRVKLKKSWPEILHDGGRLACVSLSFQTQPYGKSKASQAMGENAIRSDIYGSKSRHGSGIVLVWKDYMPQANLPENIAMLGRKSRLSVNDPVYSQGEFRRLWIDHSGTVFGVEAAMFDPEGKRLAEQHKKYRSTSTGRVSKAGSWSQLTGRTVFINKLVVKKEAIEKYIKKLVKLVGFAKGGWAMCARALGGTRGIPVWVSHQKSSGRVIDNTDNETNPSVTMINDVRYVSRCLSQNQVQRALQIAAQKLITHTDIVVAYNARQAGFSVH